MARTQPVLLLKGIRLCHPLSRWKAPKVCSSGRTWRRVGLTDLRCHRGYLAWYPSIKELDCLCQKVSMRCL